MEKKDPRNHDPAREAVITSISSLCTCLFCPERNLINSHDIPKLEHSSPRLLHSMLTRPTSQLFRKICRISYTQPGKALQRRRFATMAPSPPQYGSISQFQTALQEGKTTVKDAVQGYLDVIKARNGQLNAVTVTNEKALEEAERLDVSHSHSMP